MKRFLTLIGTVFFFVTIATNAYAYDEPTTDGPYVEANVLLGYGRGSFTKGNVTSKDPFPFFSFSCVTCDGGFRVGVGTMINRYVALKMNGSWVGHRYQTTQTTSKFLHNFDLLGGVDLYYNPGYSLGVELGYAYLLQTSNADGDSITRKTTGSGWGMRYSLGYESHFTKHLNGEFSVYYMHNFYYPKDASASYFSVGVSFGVRFH